MDIKLNKKNPLIKKLFRSSDKDKEQRELLIFITPTVVTNKI